MTGSEPRVLLDATAIPADRGGVGRYVDGLVSAYSGPLVIACQQRDVEVFRALAPEAEVVAVPRRVESTALRLLWEQFSLPRLARRTASEVIHSPHYTVPLATRRARVVTFHDATFFSDPGVHRPLKRVFFRSWIRLSARIADGVIVPSDSAGSEIGRYVRVRPAVTTAHHGVDPAAFHPVEADRVADFADRHALAGGWIAFLGTLEPRKNLPALVRALGLLARSGRRLPPLALAGGAGWDQRLDDVIAAEPQVDVRRLGYLPLDELPILLGGATLVAYPSLGEGFGLPVLEAMACGATVLTTRRLALPEVGGDAVAYAETDADALAEAVAALLDDPTRRAALATAAAERATMFTWAASARAHAAAYALATGGSR